LIVEAIAPVDRDRINAIVLVMVPSCITALLLGLSTRSVWVALATTSAGALCAWFTARLPFRMGPEEAEVLAIGSWLIIVCVTLSVWVVSARRARPWLGEPFRCRRCGYDMKGLRNPICPECGTNLRMGVPDATPRPKVTTGVPRVRDQDAR
jgi:hypothetical protein